MMMITKVKIERYRSIIQMDLLIDSTTNIIAFCGQNNVGKTNTLRALKLFFYPEEYDQAVDMPSIKNAQGGGAIHPKITLDFVDSEYGKYYSISRSIKDYAKDNSGLTGESYEKNKSKKKHRLQLTPDELKGFLESFTFVMIESVNTFIPELVSNLTEDMLNLQYDKARFSDSRRQLKDAYDTYVDGLQGVLDSFSTDISSVFQEFRDDWSVKLVVPKNSEKFRDLISDDVSMQIYDRGSNGVENKGAGLQRLATILLYFEMLRKIKKAKNIIVCIDEPDVYLHDGLQHKLNEFLRDKSSMMQVFFTTHSKVFINQYTMKNVFLLTSETHVKYSARKSKDIDVIETHIVDITDDDGYAQICDHLGIERGSYEVLEKTNILVEGASDKKYFEELAMYFGLHAPNIISLNGANNADKYLEFYESYYRGSDGTCPRIRVVFDNDAKGREVKKKIDSKTYQHLNVCTVLLTNFQCNANLALERNNTNNEIEDFIYPELVCYLANQLMSKKGMTQLRTKSICRNIQKPSFASQGILYLLEHDKNEANPDSGKDWSFASSNRTTCQIKEGLAGMLSIQANQKLIRLLDECNKKYPSVKNELGNILSFSE